MSEISESTKSIFGVLTKIEVDLNNNATKVGVEHLHQDVRWNKRLIEESKIEVKALQSSVRAYLEKK